MSSCENAVLDADMDIGQSCVSMERFVAVWECCFSDNWGIPSMAFLQTMQEKKLPLFFNIHSNVGRNCPNLREDVALVTFMLVRASQAAGKRDFAEGVTIGVYNQKCQQMIDTFLANMKGKGMLAAVDGHISRAGPSANYHGGGLFAIVQINFSFATAFSNEWPRLDKVSGCPPDLQQMITREVIAV